MRTTRPISPSFLVISSSTSLAGIVILNSRFSPSALVSVTFIAACSHSLRHLGLASVWPSRHEHLAAGVPSPVARDRRARQDSGADGAGGGTTYRSCKVPNI